jgi:hypothetical protein
MTFFAAVTKSAAAVKSSRTAIMVNAYSIELRRWKIGDNKESGT